MPKSLITGGAGFIGSHVARQCLSLGHEVIVLDDLSGGFEDHIPEGAEFIQGSVTDEKLIQQILQGRKLTIFGDGSQTRAFSYIDDVAIPIAKSVTIAEAYNQVFNIGADKPYTVNELAEVVSGEFGVTPDISYLSARNEVQHAYSD